MILATFVLYLADKQNQTDDAQRMLNDFKVTCSADNMILLLFYILFVNILKNFILQLSGKFSITFF